MGESLTDAVYKLIKRIENMELKIESLTENTQIYLRTLPEEYRKNILFSDKYPQGKNKPHSDYKNGKEMKKCFEHTNKGNWPHLFHTFDPQLNNITDMLTELLECCCHKKENTIHNDLEDAKNKLKEIIIHLRDQPTDNKEEIQNQCLKLDDIIKLLQNLNLQKPNQCLTLDELKPFLGGLGFRV